MAVKKQWVFSPQKAAKPAVPGLLKTTVQTQADALIESELKPRFVKPPTEEMRWNYIVDISSKWYRSYFYFCAQYRCPAPNCISEFFEVKFARLEYVEKDRFNLSYMRHTEQWWELYTDLPLESCLDIIRSEPHFQP